MTVRNVLYGVAAPDPKNGKSASTVKREEAYIHTLVSNDKQGGAGNVRGQDLRKADTHSRMDAPRCRRECVHPLEDSTARKVD